MKDTPLPISETIQDLEKKYQGKRLFDPRGTKPNYRQRHLDRFSTAEFTPVIHKEVPEVQIHCTQELFRERLKEGYNVYKQRQQIPALIFHPDNVATIIEIAKWICGDITGSLNTNKGLYIYGRHGSGKTDFLIILTNVAKVLSSTYPNISKWKPYSYNAIYERIRSGTEIIDVIRDQSNLAIDDFLYQDRNEAKVYGNNDSVANILVTKMYDLHKCGYTHLVTSNYPPDQIDMHTGSMDRMNEMFNYIFWEGESLRK